MRKYSNLILFMLALSFILAPGVYSQDTSTIVILNGLPIKKDMSDIEGTEQISLKKDTQWNYRVEIVKNGNKYYWVSRENKELLYSKSGGIHNFVEPKGAGYIRIVKTKKGALYIEHLTLALKNISYWGIASEINLQ